MRMFDKIIDKSVLRIFNKYSKGYNLTNVTTLKELFPQLFANKETYTSFVYSCVNTRAEKISSAKICLFDGDNEIENPNDIILKFFNKIHGNQLTFQQILYYISVCLDLYGKAFIRVIRKGLNVPDYFVFLLPDYVKTITDANGNIIKYQVNTIEGIEEIPLEDILYFYLPDMKRFMQSKATIDALADTIEINNLRKTLQKNFFVNGARIDGILQSDSSLNDDQRNVIIDMWKEYKGSKNAGKTPLLEGGIKYVPTQANAKEMDFVNSINMIRDEIFTVFRVPKVCLGISESGDSRSNAINSIRNFMTGVIIPFSRQHIFSKFNYFIQTNFRESLRIIPDYTLEQDPDVTTKEVEMLLRNKTISRNEARSIYQYDKLEGEEFNDPNQNSVNQNQFQNGT